MINNTNTTPLTITLDNGAAVTCYLAYRPCEGPDGSDWDARFDLRDVHDELFPCWKFVNAVAFVQRNAPASDPIRMVTKLEEAARALMLAESYAR